MSVCSIHVPLLHTLIVMLLLIIAESIVSSAHARGRGASGKKKVVIIGEMSDLAFEMATNASASTNYALDDVTFADYDDSPPDLDPHYHHHPESHQHHSQQHRHPGVHSKYTLSGSRPKGRIKNWVGKRTNGGVGTNGLSPHSPGSVFVPVAAYSVTHSRVGSAPNVVRRMRPGKTTESAVYGYVQKPEIVEFRGQYFYGPNPSASSHASHHYTSVPVSRHHHHYSPEMSSAASDSVASSSSWLPFSSSSNKISNKSGGLGPGGLLLATLPLILAPMLSYLFTPMVIPVTATIAAGRRRRRSLIQRNSGSESSSTTSPVAAILTHHDSNYSLPTLHSLLSPPLLSFLSFDSTTPATPASISSRDDTRSPRVTRSMLLANSVQSGYLLNNNNSSRKDDNKRRGKKTMSLTRTLVSMKKTRRRRRSWEEIVPNPT